MAKSRRPEGERSAKIGPYEVIKRVGAGGMGAVFLAKDVDLERLVALKVLPPALAAKTEMIGRFRQEAQHAAKLRHENIVTLYGCGDHKGVHYLAMEFVDGCNLLQYIKKHGKLEAEEARILTMQATKALVCAHEHNIVHRDIKPSNFLLAIHNSGPVVKLTDFGLARTVDDFDGQMTRTGTTVGTVDYISPEQARNSRAADIRSDIYSLGCTLYHMLAGRPPFPDGDLAERLLKHIETEPPDILQFNPQTPAGLVQILSKMLAKKPDARYQNPSELLQDLANPPEGPAISPREALELLAIASGEKARPTRLSSMQETQRQIKVKTAPPPANLAPAVVDMRLHYRKEKNERSPRSEKGDSAAEGPTAPFALEGLGPWLALIGCITAVAIIAMAILFKWGGKSDTPKSEDDQTTAKSREPTPEKKDTKDQSKKMVSDGKDKPKKGRDGEDPDGGRGALGTLKAAEEVPQIADPGDEVREVMTKLFSKPGAAPSVGVEPRIFQVRRGPDESNAGTYGSIAQAVAAARLQSGPTVIEIKDNGPFFESGLVIKNQSVVLRGAGGFRPLIALGGIGPSNGGHFLLTVQKANLVLENVDLVLKTSEGQQNVETGLVRLGEGNLLLEDCSLSLAGRTRDGLSAIRCDGVPTGTGQARCWLRRCLVRGGDMTALDLRGPGCSVTVDGCLVVGHEQPLLAIRGQSAEKPTEIKIARSTLVGGQSLCRVEAAGPREADVAVQLVFWDSLLARSGTSEGGEMLKLCPGVSPSIVHWRAINSLYAGWKTLLQYSGGKVAATDLAGWHSLLQQQGGDKALTLSWPAYLPPETERLPPALFRTTGTAAAFRDSTGKGVVGCPVQDLPPTRMAWPAYTYDRAAVPALDTRAPEHPPEIPNANDGRYHGGRVDVSRTDLGEHLQKLQDAGQLANRVVIHLSGRGIAYVTPFRLKDVHLLLFADSGSSAAALSPKPGASADALMSFENGSCELIGVHFSMPAGEKNAEIGSFVQMKNATLRVLGCRMKGVAAKSLVRTLIAFTGSGDSAPEHSSDCVIADCILQTSGWVVKMSGNGSTLRVQNSLLLAGEDAVVYEPGTLAGPLNLHCVLDHDTIAARRATVRIQDVTAGVLPLDPFPVQTRGCVFLNPFGELPVRAGLLAFEDQALPHGIASWQADGNAYDKQLGYALASSDGRRETSLPAEVCERIWGPLADRRGLIFDSATRDFKLEQPAFERLTLPATVRARIKGTPPGADFEQLGMGKR